MFARGYGWEAAEISSLDINHSAMAMAKSTSLFTGHNQKFTINTDADDLRTANDPYQPWGFFVITIGYHRIPSVHDGAPTDVC